MRLGMWVVIPPVFTSEANNGFIEQHREAASPLPFAAIEDGSTGVRQPRRNEPRTGTLIVQ